MSGAISALALDYNIISIGITHILLHAAEPLAGPLVKHNQTNLVNQILGKQQ